MGKHGRTRKEQKVDQTRTYSVMETKVSQQAVDAFHHKPFCCFEWVLADVKPVENVWYYDHPNGAVIWVKDVSPLDEMQDERLRYGY